ncbi:hypothetical protein GCM10010406_41370 [Streptomyces thermolineatus]|uniref:Uncharacterized protein n=1 Tax=Streptomyces thermolineatus TaxID=44033 RepID=A0ABN3MEU6_9ACTN
MSTATPTAVALAAPGECPDPSCEDGAMIDTGEACRACEQRRADRRTARKTGETGGPRAAAGRPGWWECVVCRDPQQGTASAHGECRRCQAEATVQRLTAQWVQEDTERQRAVQEAAATAAAAEQEAQERQEAEETARLRAETARQHPELATLALSAVLAPF